MSGAGKASWGWFMRVRLRRQRLAAAISVLREELKHRPESAGYDPANSLLEMAERACREGRLLMGWKYCHAARRQSVHGLPASELEVLATKLRTEAAAEGKLRSWRKEAVNALLNPPGAQETPVPVTVELVIGAMDLLDEGMDNGYMRSDLVRNQMVLLLLILVASLTAFVLMASGRPEWLRFLADPANGAPAAGGEGELILGVLAMGGIGGAFSALTSLVSSVGSGHRVPEQILDGYVTLLRPALGVAGAIVIYMFMASGVLRLFSLGPAAYLSAAFVAGFTDRLIMRGINAVVGEDRKDR